MHDLTDSQRAILAFIADEGGYSASVGDLRTAEECVDRQWLIHEGEAGYGLTVDGAYLARHLARSPN